MMKMRAKHRKQIFLMLILGSVLIIGSVHNREFIPLSSGGSGISSDLYFPLFQKDPVNFEVTTEGLEADLLFREFVTKVIDGSQGIIRGVFSSENFALPVTQQPSGQSGYVSTIDGVATQFSMAKKYGITGLLAHNYLSGRLFFNLGLGDVIQVIYGDGEIRNYQITEIQRYQALQPKSPTSQFVDLDTGERITSTQLFKRVYMGSHHLTLQTCIQEGSEDSWGRLFIIAQLI
jgi:hypothetical protein